MSTKGILNYTVLKDYVQSLENINQYGTNRENAESCIKRLFSLQDKKNSALRGIKQNIERSHHQFTQQFIGKLPELRDFQLPLFIDKQNPLPFTLKLISKIDEEINLIPPNRSEKALKRLIKLKKKVKLRDSITSLAVTVITRSISSRNSLENDDRAKRTGYQRIYK